MKISLTLDDYVSELVDKGRQSFAHLSFDEERRLTGFILEDGRTLDEMGEFLPEVFYKRIVGRVLSLPVNCLERETSIFLMLMTFIRNIVAFHGPTIDRLLERECEKRRQGES